MNKNFKKLLEASYTKGFEECARTGHRIGQLDAIFNSIVMAEFARLIVRECALTAGLMEHEGRTGIGAQILDNYGVAE